MKKLWKRGLSFALAVIMVMGVLPATIFADVDGTGRPKDLNNKLILSIYVGEGFPGEPAVYGTGDYKNINSSFKVASGATFATNASSELDAKILEDGNLVQGTPSGNTSVWGVYDTANGLESFFKDSTSTIIKNEAAIIRSVMGIDSKVTDADVLKDYQIVWYVIKLQHEPGNKFLWWDTSVTEWHIDGVIKERQKISINYYGNGNTSGSAPLGTTTHVSGDSYTILGKNDMVRKINGVEVAFLGWNTSADGKGTLYKPGTTITPTASLSLYAMWDTTTQFTATVKTYLDGDLTPNVEIHGVEKELYLSTDETHYYKLLTNGNIDKGEYTTKITGNGKFNLYHKNTDGSYTKVCEDQLTIYNQDGSLDVHHYSVSYDANGGSFDTAPEKQIYLYGESVTAITAEPKRDGYRFLGWKNGASELIKSGDEVTPSITNTITLTAQWEKTVNVTVNVRIDHKGDSGDGYDKVDDKGLVNIALVSRVNSDAPYLETGNNEWLKKDKYEGDVTEYSHIFTDMPGGTAEYTVVASKSGYETVITAEKIDEGNWVIWVEMTYKPTNFDLDFTVKVDVDEDVPKQLIPKAAIVKVTFWADRDGEEPHWEIITQQNDGKPGVRVDIDPTSLSGEGSYPVWMYESGGEIPYGYRIQVTAFVYPDGTIVPVEKTEPISDVEWSDGVYTATMTEVTDGKEFGELQGAYYSKDDTKQIGTLHADITIDLHSVTFDANGGKVNGKDEQTAEYQYKIPAFKDYVPTRDGGYTFGGWYMNKECTVAATEGKDLEDNITLYAKWIEPLTISGTVTVAGTYKQNEEYVSVNDIDRAEEAVVVLQELRNGTAYDIDSVTVTFGKYDNYGSAEYKFEKIPNDGKEYKIHVLELNYSTKYENESKENSAIAVFGNDNKAVVNAYLEFVPPSYTQNLLVDANQIGEGFRPVGVLSEVLYRDTGDIYPYQRISQHNVDPFGVQIGMSPSGNGEGSQSIWKWHTDGTLYEYQMNISKYTMEEKSGNVTYDYNSDTAPFYILYDAPAYWDNSKDNASGDLKATLIPKTYLVTFNLNANGDTVTGMDAYKVEGTDDVYQTTHTWSKVTTINAVPTRQYHKFLGWEVEVDGDYYYVSKISAKTCQEVVLTAQWEYTGTYSVVTTSNPTAGGTTTGDGEYTNGSTVTVTAEPKQNYKFEAWYENGNIVSTDAEYTFTITKGRVLTAKFTNIGYKNDYAYIFGYTDTVMGAEGMLLRCEVAVMVHRLAKQNNERDGFVYNSAYPYYSDIEGEWFQCGIEYIRYRGGFSAPKGTDVKPLEVVTRGEVFKIVALGLKFTDDTKLSNDEYAQLLYDNGYIVGDENGNLNVGNTMTRAEFCTMFNRIIGRSEAVLEDEAGNKITHETYNFTDLDPEKWYYEDMIRATSAYTNGFVDINKRGIRNVVDDYN